MEMFKDFEQWAITIFDNILLLAHDEQDACDKLEKFLLPGRVLGPPSGGAGPERGIPGEVGSLRVYSSSQYTPRAEKGPGWAGGTGTPEDPDK